MEDDASTRERLGALLRSHNFSVELLGSGAAAIERAQRGGVDLCLLDVMMPGVGGLEACRVLKAMTKDGFLPIILLTAKADAASRVEGLRIGADDYVSKPFDERELVARVEAMLRIKRMHDEVHAAKQRLAELAITDELTGLHNFRYLHTRLREEFKRAERYRDPLACAMVDIDRFKSINDNHGHDTGDAVLAEVARRVKQVVREIDVVTRYGGDELLIMLPNTHFSGAVTVAHRLWSSVRALAVTAGTKQIPVSVSVGVALYPSRDVTTKQELLRAADQALYQAKRDGRDRICVFQHQSYIYRPDVPEL
ncbi:MAG: diguanylate cyclase [Myxococcota bacterium]